MGEAGQAPGDRTSRVGQGLQTALAALQDRAELLALETREQELRLVETVVWAAIACFLAQGALIFATLALAAAFPERAAWILGLAALLYLAGAGSAGLVLRRRMAQRPPPFAGTVAELRKDREWLSSLN